MTRSCKFCGRYFIPNKYTPKRHIYCSQLCNSKGRNREVYEEMIRLGIKKRRGTKEEDPIRIAKHRARSLRYQERKLYGREKKEFMLNYCIVCEAKDRKLIAHHINGEGWGKIPDNRLENLTTLCITCHMKLHMNSLERDTPLKIKLHRGLGREV